MHHFDYKNDRMYCEDVSVDDIAAEVGTPFYLYSASTIARHFTVFSQAFASVEHLVCYSVKANSNLAVLRLLANMGAGADIVSGGELFRALKAGIDPQKIVFSGVGKHEEEIRFAIESGILMFNVESGSELNAISRVAGQMGKVAPVALRVNPDVDPGTHPYISTGMKKNKFGIPFEDALATYRAARNMENIEVVGADCHIGSQLTSSAPFGEAVSKMMELVRTLEEEGIPVKYVDVGGGLGIVYGEEAPPMPSDYAEIIIKAVGDTDKTLILEPGRVIVGNAGILVTKVIYNKKTALKHFVIVDAAMNDLIRPALYDAYQEIRPIRISGDTEIVADVVGPICESTDYLARDFRMQSVAEGDLLAVMSSGAYGFPMASQYNSRPRGAEVLVIGDRFQVVRSRETYDDLVRGEMFLDD